MVTVNAVLLRGEISFFQTVSSLGYTLAPLVVSAALCKLFTWVLLQLLFLAVGLAWSATAAFFQLSQMPGVPAGKRPLVLYPLVLFYLSVSGLILVYSPSSEEANVTPVNPIG